MGQLKIKKINGTESVEDITNSPGDGIAPEPVYVPSSNPGIKPGDENAIKKKNGLNKTGPGETLNFSKHAVPSQQEMREEEINESLMEIYQNDDGEIMNVSQLDERKKHGFVYNFFMTLFVLGIIAGAGFYGYNELYLSGRLSSGTVELSVDAPKEVISGEEFFYTINYKNLSNVAIKNIEIRTVYPENFVYLESSPLAKVKNNLWQPDNLDAHRSGQIRIKGKIVGPKDQVGLILASLIYVPENFSSEFKKESSLETVVNGIGIDFNFDSHNSVLVNEANNISIKFRKAGDNYINNFRLSVSGPDNFTLYDQASATSTAVNDENIEKIKPGVWQIKNLSEEQEEMNIGYKFKEKINPTEDVMLYFEFSEDNVEYYQFLEKKISFEIIKNDLNLNLILNGSRNDQGIDFGQTLNYSIVYANKGDEEMKDIIVMAVLNADIIDWTSLADENKGKVRGNTISWSKDEIPALASLIKNSEGMIDFSIKVVALDKVKAGSAGYDPNRKYEVQSYAQFTIGSNDSADNEDTKSNIIASKVNSDLKLDEQVRYFNSDNIAVGSGPLPPKVGQTTSYKVFWVITNNLHELNSLKAEVALPVNVQWEDKNRATAGSIRYDANSRRVIWDIGRLPVEIYEISGEFSINVTPVEADKDTIMVLLPGTLISAIDNVTGAPINLTTKAKTTKLDDDEIANTDGRVVR